jgi:hypothetical protein
MHGQRSLRNRMSKASEDKLGELHGAVAQVLKEVVTHQEAAVEYDAEGNAECTGEMQYTASPAMMATAVKFLKDNSITCDVSQDENMNTLRDALAKKQKRSRLDAKDDVAASLEMH